MSKGRSCQGDGSGLLKKSGGKSLEEKSGEKSLEEKSVGNFVPKLLQANSA